MKKIGTLSRGIAGMIFLVLLFSSVKAQQDQSEVTGTVTTDKGEPLNAVTVRVINSAGSEIAATTTNVSGIFIFNDLKFGEYYNFRFSYIGYDAFAIDKYVVKKGEKNSILVKLKEAGSNLDQVVVVGYGSQKKIDITGSVAQVKSTEIAKQVVSNAMSALQGKVAGVQIDNNGQPGSAPSVKIRGYGTVFGNPNPLYVVDGVWYDDISFLNPSDIDNISILKDPSSQALYGIKSANGVMLITTKSGKLNQLPVINFTTTLGFQHVTNEVQMASAKEYAILTNEFTGEPVLNPDNYGQGTNWYNQILHTAVISNSQISVSGGSDRSTYNFSLGYLDQQGILKNNDFKRLTAHFQNDFTIKKGLKVGYSIVANGFTSNGVPTNIFYQAYVAPPNFVPKNSNGSYGDPVQFGNFANPQATLDFFNSEVQGMQFSGSIYLDWKITDHLSFHTSFGGQYTDSSTKSYVPAYTATAEQFNPISSLTQTKSQIRNWIVENTFKYDQTFGRNHFTFLLGQTAQEYNYYQLTGNSVNVPNQNSGSWYLNLGDQGTRNVTDYGDLYTVLSYFGRMNYAYSDRYLLTVTMRADGSSKFSENEKWGYFPSVGAAWIVSKENFMSNQRIFDELKVRGSWGITGNASVPSNLSTVVADNGAYYISYLGGVPNTGQGINSVVPPNLYWEKGEGVDLGLEMSFLKNKLTADADYYNRKTEKAIFSVPILGNVGANTSSLIANNATFQNEGFELTLNYRGKIGNNMFFNINANGAINNNTVLSIATGSVPFYSGTLQVGGFTTTRTVTGSPIGQFFGLKETGIFQNQQEIDNSAQAGTAVPGDFKYQDVNKDGVIDQRDWVVLGNPNPKYIYGINTFWQLKEFDLEADFQGVAKVDVYNAIQGTRYGNENYTQDYYDHRWHGEGTSNKYPGTLNGNNLQPNSFFVQNGSYFRIRTLQLGYSMAQTTITNLKLQKLRFFVNVQNPLTLFGYKGFTPEVGGAPTKAGIDYNTYPLSAIYNFGINVSF